MPSPLLLQDYTQPLEYTLSDAGGNTFRFTVTVTTDGSYYGVWFEAGGEKYYPTADIEGVRNIILPAEVDVELHYQVPEGGSISPEPDLSTWTEREEKAFTITDAAGNRKTETYRYVRNNYFTMIVFGDPEFDMREYSLANGEIKGYIDRIIALKDNEELYFEPVQGLRVDYGPEIVLCAGDVDKDGNSRIADFTEVFGALYENGIPFVTVYGNHDWSPYNYWYSYDNGTRLELDPTDYGYVKGVFGIGQQDDNERTLELVNHALAESEKLGITVERRYLSTDFGHNYDGEVMPFVFSFRGVRFYCGQTYWFQQWYKPNLLKISPATFYCTDEIMEDLERRIDEGWGEAPAVWLQHYPMSDTQTDGGSAMWWHNRQGFGPEANDPNANQSVKWRTYEDKVAQMMKVIGKTKNPVFFAGHTHEVAQHVHKEPAFTEYITPYFHNASAYVVLMKEGYGAVEVKRIDL